MIAFLLDLHRIAESAGSPGDDRDLLDRSTVGLHSSHQCVTDLVIGNDQFFFVSEDGILFLVAGDDDLDALLHIRLICKSAPVPDSPQRCLIDDIGKFGAGSSGCHAGDLAEIDIAADFDLLGVDLQNIDAALQVGKLHRDTPVESSGSGQSRIERFGAVCRSQDDDAEILLKAVHLSQQLVQSLLALIIASEGTSVTLFADRVDLVNKNDTGRFFFCLLEEITHLGGTHADKHLHKLRTGHGEEGHIGFARHSLGQHCLAGPGRAHQQDTLGHGGADLFILSGIVQVLHDLHQVFLGFLFPRDIAEADALGRFDVDLGVAPAHAEHHGRCSAVGAVDHFFVQIIAESSKNRDRQYPVEQKCRHGRRLRYDITPEFCPGLIETLNQSLVRHISGAVDLAVLIRKQDIAGSQLDLLDLLAVRHRHKCLVADLLDRSPLKGRHDKSIDDHHEQDDQQTVIHH